MCELDTGLVSVLGCSETTAFGAVAATTTTPPPMGREIKEAYRGHI